MVGRRAAAALAGAAVIVIAASCSLDIGNLGGSQARAFDVNDAGVVVGSAETGDGDIHAFRRLPDSTMIDLGTLPDGIDSAALAVNEAGQVAGTATTPGANPAVRVVHAVRWDADGSIHDLGVISGAGGLDPTVVGIDEAGRVVGDRVVGGVNRAFLYDPAVGHLQDLPGLPGVGTSYVNGINDVGDVVGVQYLGPLGHPAAVRWDLDAGTVTDLSDRWGNGLVVDINDAGVIAGLVYGTPGGPVVAILRPGDVSPGLLDVGPSPIPLAINDHDVVVGYHGEDGPVVGFRWEASTGSVDLPGNDDNGTIARSINDRDQVVGMDGPAAVFLFP